jgi:hypothetical protein
MKLYIMIECVHYWSRYTLELKLSLMISTSWPRISKRSNSRLQNCINPCQVFMKMWPWCSSDRVISNPGQEASSTLTSVHVWSTSGSSMPKPLLRPQILYFRWRSVIQVLWRRSMIRSWCCWNREIQRSGAYPRTRYSRCRRWRMTIKGSFPTCFLSPQRLWRSSVRIQNSIRIRCIVRPSETLQWTTSWSDRQVTTLERCSFVLPRIKTTFGLTCWTFIPRWTSSGRRQMSDLSCHLLAWTMMTSLSMTCLSSLSSEKTMSSKTLRIL